MIVFAKVHDRERFMADYAAPTAALIGAYGGEYVVRGPGVTALEGGLFDGASGVISKWPSREAIERFYTSPEYQKLIQARRDIADANIMVLEDPS